MPPNDGNTLGSANVRITADTTDLNAKVDQAKAKVAEIGPAATTAKSEADALFKSMVDEGNKAADATAKTTAAVGGLNTGLSTLASVGATAAIAVIAKLIQMWIAAKEAADAAREASLKAFQQEQQRLDAASEALDELGAASSAFAKEQMAAAKAYEVGAKVFEDRLRKAGKASKETYDQLLKDANEFEQKYLDTQKDIADRYSKRAREKAAINDQKIADAAIAADEKMYEEFYKNSLDFQKEEDKAIEKNIRNNERRIEQEERIARIRIRGILDADQALERMYARQAAGFNGEGSNNSLQGSIDALEIAIRGMAARSGGT